MSGESFYQLAIAPRLRREVELSSTLEQKAAQSPDFGVACWHALSSCEPNGFSLCSILGAGSRLGGQIALRIAQRAISESFEQCMASSPKYALDVLSSVVNSTHQALLKYRSGMSGSSGVAARGVVGVRLGAELVVSTWGDFACLLKRGSELFPLVEGEKTSSFAPDLGQEEFSLGRVFQIYLEHEDIVLLSSFSSIDTVAQKASQILDAEEDLDRKAWKMYRNCLEGQDVQTQPYLMLIEAQQPVIVLSEVV